MAAWWDGLDVTVEIALGYTPSDEVLAWTDVSDYVRGTDGHAVRVNRGRSDEYSPFAPGVASFALDNRDRWFDPSYAAGPFYGDLTPMCPVRVTAEYNSNTYPVYFGYVLGWPQTPYLHFDSIVTINCVDGTRLLANAPLSNTAIGHAIIGDGAMHYWPLQEESTRPNAKWRDVIEGLTFEIDDPDQAGIPFGPVRPSRAPGYPEVVTDQEFPHAADTFVRLTVDNYPTASWVKMRAPGREVVGPPAGISFWAIFDDDYPAGLTSRDSWSVADGTGNISVAIFGGRLRISYDNDGDDTRYNDISGVIPVPQAGLHHIALWADSSDIYLYVDGRLRFSDALSATSSPDTQHALITFYEGTTAGDRRNTYVSHFAAYPVSLTEPDWREQYIAGMTAFGHPYSEQGGARIERVLDEAGWPTTFRSIQGGATNHGPYEPNGAKALDYLRQIETAEAGFFFISAAGDATFRGRSFRATQNEQTEFADDGTGVPFSSLTFDAANADTIGNEVVVTYGAEGFTAKARNPSSIDDFGAATVDLFVPTIDSPGIARGLAKYTLTERIGIRQRVTSITVQPRADPETMFPEILALELGDKVRVTVTPMNVGSPQSHTYTVSGIDSTMDASDWQVTYYLSPAVRAMEEVPYLVVGDATYGEIGASAGNKVAF